MEKEQLNNSELDKLMLNALIADKDLSVPPGLADKTIRKLEKRILLRELILELFIKLSIVLISLTILTVVFIWFNGSEVISNLYSHFISNWQIFTSVLLLVFITILIDQVGLRLYNSINKEVDWKV